MIQINTLVAIILIAMTTYLTRLLGYVLLKNKTLTQRQRKILEVVPGSCRPDCLGFNAVRRYAFWIITNGRHQYGFCRSFKSFNRLMLKKTPLNDL